MEPCTTATQTKCHWSKNLVESLGGGREGTTLCGQDAVDQIAANSDCVAVMDIAQELPPCVACAIIAFTEVEDVEQPASVRSNVYYAAQTFVNGEPVGTPLWEANRELVERMASDHERRLRRLTNFLSDVPQTSARDVCVKVVRRVVVTVDL